MTGAELSLEALAATVDWPDADAAGAARTAAGRSTGRLDELVEFLAGASGQFPPPLPRRPRCLVLGPVDDHVATLAGSLDVGVRGVEIDGSQIAGTALGHGIRLADEEADSGTDLLVLATPTSPAARPAAAVVLCLVAGVEPVQLLPRGEDAVDTASWIAQAAQLRDTRRATAGLRRDPAALLAHLDDPALATATGVLLRASARRTPVVLDGATAVAAGVLAADLTSRAARWWRVADRSPDPVHARAVTELDQQPLLDLGAAAGDGTAGLLTVPLLRAAVLSVLPGLSATLPVEQP